jgi:hypothetical protein
MAFVYSLNAAADFGDLLGQPGGDQYRALAEIIKARSKRFLNQRKSLPLI